MGRIDEIKGNPIVIGITGHRDLREEDLGLLETRVTELFDKVQAAHPNTPVTLLSPLAEGGDRLVACIARARGFDVIALLPMPREEYMNDYTTQESRDEFNQLLTQAKRVIELPLLPGSTAESIQGFTEDRMKQYISVGAYTSRFSHILLALWNGIDNKLPGGTADVVKYKDQGIPEGFEPASKILDLEPVDGGLVYHIVTPRRSNVATTGEVGAVFEYFYG